MKASLYAFYNVIIPISYKQMSTLLESRCNLDKCLKRSTQLLFHHDIDNRFREEYRHIKLILLSSLSFFHSIQTGELPTGDYIDHSQEICATLRRSSSGHAFESSNSESSTQVLGTLHCTIRYSFDKNALVVTVNRCENLPAKDTAAKSRYVDYTSSIQGL